MAVGRLLAAAEKAVSFIKFKWNFVGNAYYAFRFIFINLYRCNPTRERNTLPYTIMQLKHIKIDGGGKQPPYGIKQYKFAKPKRARDTLPYRIILIYIHLIPSRSDTFEPVKFFGQIKFVVL